MPHEIADLFLPTMADTDICFKVWYPLDNIGEPIIGRALIIKVYHAYLQNTWT